MSRRPPRPARTPARTAPPVEDTLTIERLVPGGQGLARVADGVVFVDGVAAGDVVRVRRDGRQGGASRARVLAVVSPSADRARPADVAADCGIAEACGGCDWLHLTREARDAWKVRVARDALRRIGRLDDTLLDEVLVPLVTGNEQDRTATGRRRVRVVVGDDGGATWSAPRSHDRVAIPACRALHPVLEAEVLQLDRAALPAGTEVRLAVDDRGHVVAAVARAVAARSLVEAGVVVGAVAPRLDGSAFSADDVAVVGEATLQGEITAGHFPARNDAAVFSQATRFGGAAIRAAVMAAVDDVLDGALVLELFCGAGHLTLPLAARARSVVAIEGDARAVRFLRDNLRLLGDGAGRVEPRVAYIDAALTLPPADVVVVDPPRTGLTDGPALLSSLSATRLVMVSCDPATGARDLRAALDAGYRLQRLTPIDAFPRTHHLEWVAVLKRAG